MPEACPDAPDGRITLRSGWERDGHVRALAFAARERDRASVLLDERPRDREAEAGARDRVAGRGRRAEEAREDLAVLVGGMPMPVSATVSRSPPRSASTLTVTRPPSPVNFTAFETRLSITCEMRAPSASTSGGWSATSSSVTPFSAAPVAPPRSSASRAS